MQLQLVLSLPVSLFSPSFFSFFPPSSLSSLLPLSPPSFLSLFPPSSISSLLPLSPPSFLYLLPPSSLSSLLFSTPTFLSPPSFLSLLQQKLSEAQKACERVYALEELIETLQEEQQVSHDESSRVFANRGWPWYLTGGLGDSVWMNGCLCSPATGW